MILSKSWPALPTNGLPCKSSFSPGPSPTKTISRVRISFAGNRVPAKTAKLALPAGVNLFGYLVKLLLNIIILRLVWRAFPALLWQSL